MKRIGNNINQLARYVNIHKEEVNQEVLNEVEKKMADYVIMQDKLNVTWRKLYVNHGAGRGNCKYRQSHPANELP